MSNLGTVISDCLVIVPDSFSTLLIVEFDTSTPQSADICERLFIELLAALTILRRSLSNNFLFGPPVLFLPY